MSSTTSLDVEAYQGRVRIPEAKKRDRQLDLVLSPDEPQVSGYNPPHHFEVPKVVSTADAVSAARKNWTGEDITSQTKFSFKKQVSRKLRSAKSFLKGFWWSKYKEDDKCSEEAGNKEDSDGEGDSDVEEEGEVSLMPESTRCGLASHS
eukprot:gene18833-25379_t